MGELDSSFIQDLDQRPKFKTMDNHLPLQDEIPVIDLSAETPQVVFKIRKTCQKYGFFQVINHGVPPELCQNMEKVAKEFFHLPLEEKRKVKRIEVDPMGFYNSEHTKNVRDWKEVFDYLALDPTLIPASPDPDDNQLRTLRIDFDRD